MSSDAYFGQDKLFQYLDRLSDYVNNGHTVPVTWEIDLTNRCNNNCPGCIGYRQNQVSLETEEARSYVRQIRDLGGLGLIFTGGGEPMLHPDVDMVVQYSASLGLKVGFITNGHMPVSVTDSTSLLASLALCSWVRVSLDAGSPEVYEKMHGVSGALIEEPIRFVRMLAAYCKGVNSNTTIGVGYLTREPTQTADAEQAVLMVKGAGAHYLQFRPMHGSRYNFIPVAMELARKYNSKSFKVVSSDHKYRHMISPMLTPGRRDYAVCHGADFASTICADAKVYVCCHLRANPAACLGDLREQSLADIWASEHRKTIIRAIDVSKCVPLCRCDSLNRIIDGIVCREHPHKEFL